VEGVKESKANSKPMAGIWFGNQDRIMPLVLKRAINLGIRLKSLLFWMNLLSFVDKKVILAD